MEDPEAIPPTCWPVDYLRQLDWLLTPEGGHAVDTVQAALAEVFPIVRQQPTDPEPPALRLRRQPPPPEAA